MIIITSDSRLLSPRVESYIEVWCIKDCDYLMAKQRSKIRNIIQKNSLITPEGFKLQDNEFLMDTLNFNLNGRYEFDLIPEWNDELSKCYRIENSSKTQKTQIELTSQILKKPSAENLSASAEKE